MNYKKLLAFVLATIMMSQIAVSSFANEDILSSEKPKESVLDSTPRQDIRYFSFLPDQNAPEKCQFDLKINMASTWWQSRMREGIRNWNNAVSYVDIKENSSSKNTATAGDVTDTWTGLYSATINASTDTFIRFNIHLNTRQLPADNINDVQGTATHELGHALHLADNPREDDRNASIMNYRRDRDTIYQPTSHDIESVHYYYDDWRKFSKSNEPETGVPETGESELNVLIADYLEHLDTQNMIDDADIIVRCRVLDMTKEEFLDVGLDVELPYTIATAEVSETFKGEVAVGDQLEIKQLGGENIKVRNAIYLENSEYLLLLKSYDNSPYSMINPIQGQYLVEDTEFISMDGNRLSMQRSLLA